MRTHNLNYINNLLNSVILTGYVRHDENLGRVWIDHRKGEPSNRSVWVRSEMPIGHQDGNLVTMFCHIRPYPDSGFILDAIVCDDAWFIYLDGRARPSIKRSNQAKVAAIVTDIELWYRPRLWVRQHRNIEKEFPVDLEPTPGLKRRLKRISVGDLLFFQGKIVRTDDEYGQSFLVSKIADVTHRNVLGQIESVKQRLLTTDEQSI